MAEDHDGQLGRLREEIDTVDEQIIMLLGKRFKLTHSVGVFKRNHKITSQSHDREAYQMERISKIAIANGVDPAYAKRFLRMTIDEVIQNHKALKKQQEDEIHS